MNPEKALGTVAATSMDDNSVDLVVGLLANELDSAAAEADAYTLLTGIAQPLTKVVRHLVRTNDVHRLETLANDKRPLHDLLIRLAPPHAKVADLLDPPYVASDPAPANALRAMATLGLALTDDERRTHTHLGTVLAWLNATRTFLPGPLTGMSWLPTTNHPDRMERLASLLRIREGKTLAALTWLLDLDQAPVKRVPGPAVQVLLDGGNRGQSATLRLTTIPDLPPCLLPDPRTMALFTADDEFQLSMSNAWTIHAPHVNKAVLWSLEDADGPIERVIGPSLGAAFAVLVDELRRLTRPVVGRLTVLRVTSRTAFIGALDSAGRLQSVSGYPTKLDSATEVERVVVPAPDVETARQHAHGPEIVPADTWRTAARVSRKRDRHALQRITILMAVVLVVAAVGVMVVVALTPPAESIAEQQRRVAKAHALASQAEDAMGDSPQLALRLSLAAYRLDPSPETRASLTYILATGTFSRVLGDSDSSEQLVAASRERPVLATANDDGVTLWDNSDAAHSRRLGQLPTGPVIDVALSNNGRVLAIAADAEEDVALWDIRDLSHPRRLGHLRRTTYARKIALSPDGRAVAIATTDVDADDGQDIVTLWDGVDIAHPRELGRVRTDSVNAMAWRPASQFGPSGHVLATAGDNGAVTVWHLTGPGPLRRLGQPLQGHQGPVNTMAFGPNGHMLATGGDDGTVIVWNTRHLADPPLRFSPPLTGHTADPVNAVAFSRSGHMLAAGATGGTMTVWSTSDPVHPSQLSQLTGYTGYMVAFSPDGRILAADSDGAVNLWDTKNLWAADSPIYPIGKASPGFVRATTLGPSGRHIVVTGGHEFPPPAPTEDGLAEDGTAELWEFSEPTNPHRLSRLVGDIGQHTPAAFSRNADTLATLGGDGTVTLWSTADPRHPRELCRLAGIAGRAVAVSPDGRTVAVAARGVAIGDSDAGVTLWDVTDPTRPRRLGRTLVHDTQSPSMVAISPDGHTLATAANDGTVALWDITDPAHPRSFGPPQVGHNEPVQQVIFSSDGRILATASTNNLSLWQLSEARVPRKLTQVDQAGSVQAVAFSPSSDIMATGSASGAVMLWDITNPSLPRQLGRPLTNHVDRVYLMAFDATGNIMTTSGLDGTITWQFTELNDILQHTIDRACERASRGFNEQEWNRYVGDGYEYRPSCQE